MKKLFFLLLAVAALASCAQTDFYKAEDGRITLGGVPQYYVGTNLWYASELALSDPARLTAELDSLKALGIWNLRVLATDENFEGMDIALREMSSRGMAAVMFLNNAWEWSPDGYRSYLAQATGEYQAHPATDGYGPYCEAMSKFARNETAMQLYREHVERVVTRYKDNPTVFSWQLCNEPRPFSSEPEAVEAFVKYIQGTADFIKSLDSNHMVSTGSEGSIGCNQDIELFERTHNWPSIDYCTIHIWPYNWSWVDESSVASGMEEARKKIGQYIDEHILKCYRMGKPVVVEEFGYPRDGFEWRNTGTTHYRDSIYAYVFDRVIESARKGDRLAGCNFWGWSGLAKQTNQFWQEGDDLCGDPSQEAQGLNGVYLSDLSTIDVIRSSTEKLAKNVSVFSPIDKWMFLGEGPYVLPICLSGERDLDLELKVDLLTDLSLMSEVKDTVFRYSETVKAPAGLKTVEVSIPGLEPGFYQVCLSIGKPHPNGLHWFEVGKFNIGVNPEQIVSPQDKPEDFDAFWEQTLAELAAVPMDVTMTEEPEHSNELRKTYTVEFKSLGGVVAGGRLCMPVAPGKYRTYIDYMGYGANPFWYDPSADPETVEFLVSVRDQGIFKRYGQYRWIDRGLASRDDFYYRGAYCDVKRAVDFVCSLDAVDQDHLFARGESQGGAFTWISASLDDRIDAAAPAVPFLSDYEDYGRIVRWPMWEVYEQAESEGIEREALLDMMRYFDVKNFTDRITCPVYMAFGLQDPTCPPHTNFAGYNQVTAPKSYWCVPTCGHGMWLEPSWTAERAAFFEKY